MLQKESRQAVDLFLASAKKEFSDFADKLGGGTYEKAAEMILDAQRNGNRLHITGIGKPGHVSAYMASLLSSTGNPCYFLHGTEAVHGSCGQLVAGDVVICISNSGETAELKATAIAVRNNGCKLIAVTGNPQSWLGTYCDACLYAGVKEEGGPLNRAPRNSILAELLTLQALSVALQAERGWNPEQYVRCHPGGKLGQLKENEK
ncbi:SIS domain-containing protein [Caproiciproducens sp. NJN-50]|uniref:KpsF/GutQ family sugar-phosphate isomerase n=1 Tax=Caproiciproducens sp. NJN-50 TaxID=2507162 RepID=UPI000FFE218C|nr:SIS domain-containing protein [Caproiciproducens sp. NJN-50]QAT51333.1 SIS domain-containing protein [Caproiciproducens sp. NJN-50]